MRFVPERCILHHLKAVVDMDVGEECENGTRPATEQFLNDTVQVFNLV
jgi:hypothetical protein